MQDAVRVPPKSSARAVAICAFAYLYVFPYQERINNPNENVRFYMTAALVEEGRYEIDGMRARFGWVNDAATHAGHVYSVKAPGTSWLAVPGYAGYLWLSRALGQPYDRSQALWACRLCASMLPMLVFLWFFHRFLGRSVAHPVLRDTTFFSVALGSLLYGYGMLLVSHALSAATAFSAFAILLEARASERPTAFARAALAGFLAAATTLLEYPGLPCSLALTLYAVFALKPRFSWKPLAAFAGGALPLVLAMMHFQWRAFGSPFTPGHLMVENAAFREAHHQGFYGAVGPSPDALYGLLLDPGAGLFLLTPLLWLALPGFYLAWRARARRPETLCALAVVALTVLAISSMNNWRGGWTIGPRYLALCVPFLGFFAAGALERFAERAEAHALALGLGAMLASFVASGLPSAYYPHLPPELTRPLPQLFAVLIEHDYAPHNAGNWLGVYGTLSMLPLLLAGLLALACCLGPIADLRGRVLIGLGACAVGLCLLLPLMQRPAEEPGVPAAVGFVTGHFSPEGHDAAARLRQKLERESAMREQELRQLADIYNEEGRTREAERALHGKL